MPLPIRIFCSKCKQYAGIDARNYKEPERDQFGTVWTKYDQTCDDCRLPDKPKPEKAGKK